MTDNHGRIELENGRHIQWKWIAGGGYADALWTRDLQEDEEANWKFLGEMLDVSVFDGEDWLGAAVFSYLCEGHGGHLACFNIYVNDDYRRQGIATALYNAASEQFGDIVLPYPGNEGGAIQHFWVNRLKEQPDLLDRFRSDIGGPALEIAFGPRLY
jgi:GNAT superfamily N-acetyltransferase